MRSEEILDAIAELDRSFPTDRWQVGGLHALPLVRYEIHNGNHDLHHRRSGNARAASHRVVEAIRVKTQAASRFARAELFDRSASARVGPVDALLYSSGVSFTQLSGRYYDRFLDPLRELLAREGVRTLLATPHHNYFFPRHSSSVFVQPSIDAARLRGMVASRIVSSDVELPKYEEAVEFLKGRYPRMALPSPSLLRRLAVNIESFASLYSSLLRRARPRVVYLVCFYGSERFAMVLAARRLGIPTVDIQHGYAGEHHWAYSRWANMPSGGYELLPKYFWCWSEDERRTMSEWADRSHGAHRVLVGGNLFSNMWRAGGMDIVDHYDSEVKALLANHGGKVSVLFAANGLETDEQLRKLAGVIRATSSEMFWHYRLHPCRPADGSRVAEVFRTSGASTYEIELATKLPLYALLRHVSLHVTEASTTVIEASDFGVPSVLMGTAQAPSFVPYIASGWLRVADTPEGIPELLRVQLARRDALRQGLANVASPPGLDELLALAKGGADSRLSARARNS